MIVPGHPELSIDPEVCEGKPVVTGTKIRVSKVVDMVDEGADIASILMDFPSLTLSAIEACLSFVGE
jgi:uncharacterized protein (DUF433 family)